MNDNQLREAMFQIQQRYGTPTTFIANRVGVSREHLSRWLHNVDYVISKELLNKLKHFVKEER
ncbi:hypothetical protein [Paenibacillus algicola]|uniref:hypothetical protein n=1 Tax=Paenibacillus algicola TaxID=2565926 RepID=UPI0010FDC5B1|nr:hypothetical protein [Paenibacillus algicola]